MKLLLDTRILLWWLPDDALLPVSARAAIAEPDNDALVSSATAWEIAIKRAIGRVQAPCERAPDVAVCDRGMSRSAIIEIRGRGSRGVVVG